MAALTAKDKLQAYVDAVWVRMQQIGITVEADCRGVVWGRGKGPNVQLGKAFDFMANSDFDLGLRMGQLQVCRDLVDAELRGRMIDLLDGHALAAAFVIRSALRDDALHGSPLTEAEQRRLLALFHSAYQPDGRSKCPNVEAAIEEEAARGETYAILPPAPSEPG